MFHLVFKKSVTFHSDIGLCFFQSFESQCEHLLYRLQNGELPSSLHAKVFWILIGTNDLGEYGCNAESIAAGNIRIVQEIQKRRPRSESTIVLNSILPRAGSDDRHPEVNVLNRMHDRQWPTIQRANQWLKCYADSTHGVEFFNASSIFLDENGNGIQNYFDDPVHPSAEGQKQWADAITKMIFESIG